MNILASSLEGNRQKLDGGAMFGNAPKALWSRWMQADELNRIEIACRCLLVENLNGKTVLFETGIGNYMPQKLRERFGVFQDRHILIDSLDTLGLQTDDIDLVVLSHLHFDHAGGLLKNKRDGHLELIFKNADFLVGETHWQRAKSPHPRDRASFIPELCDLLEATDRLHLCSGKSHPLLGEEVKLHYTDGHTPGMMHAEICSQLFFAADMIPGENWVHLPITMGYDRCPESLINEKKKILDYCSESHCQIFYTHDPESACSKVELSDDKRYVPVASQQQLNRFKLK